MTLTIAIIASLSVGATLGYILAGLMFAAKRGDEQLRVWVVESETSGSQVDTRIN